MSGDTNAGGREGGSYLLQKVKRSGTVTMHAESVAGEREQLSGGSDDLAMLRELDGTLRHSRGIAKHAARLAAREQATLVGVGTIEKCLAGHDETMGNGTFDGD